MMFLSLYFIGSMIALGMAISDSEYGTERTRLKWYVFSVCLSWIMVGIALGMLINDHTKRK